jgi:hypothetical protein
VLLVVVPSPSCPEPLYPQAHQTSLVGGDVSSAYAEPSTEPETIATAVMAAANATSTTGSTSIVLKEFAFAFIVLVSFLVGTRTLPRWVKKSSCLYEAYEPTPWQLHKSYLYY